MADVGPPNPMKGLACCAVGFAPLAGKAEDGSGPKCNPNPESASQLLLLPSRVPTCWCWPLPGNCQAGRPRGRRMPTTPTPSKSKHPHSPQAGVFSGQEEEEVEGDDET